SHVAAYYGCVVGAVAMALALAGYIYPHFGKTGQSCDGGCVMAGKSFAFMNLKGGVGKTVLTANIAREIVRQHDKKIRLVDLDPQCSLSYLFAEPAEIDKMRKAKTAHETLYPEDGGPESLLDEAKSIYEDSPFLGRRRTAKIDLVFGS